MQLKMDLKELTKNESKLASYWSTPFKKICLGMTVNSDRRWMVLNYEASSLYNLIADGQYRNTTAVKNTWKSLIASSALQEKCNLQGFNINKSWTYNTNIMKARLAFAANNEDDCESPDSWIGYGVRYIGWQVDIHLACGNHVGYGKPRKHIPAFGYILVQ